MSNLDQSPSASARPKRSGPRPLALHIAQAEWAWRAEKPKKLADFYRGVKAYRRHPYRKEFKGVSTVWQRGSSRLLDGGPEAGLPLLVIPSLINRAYILDLMPGASLLNFLRENGIRPLLFDWGEGTAMDRGLTLDGLILDRLRPAFDWLFRDTGKRPMVLGYCMGGTLATALACLCANRMTGLALLATPWDFHSDGNALPHLATSHDAVARLTGATGSASVDLLQTLFTQIDPLSVPRKFVRFANMMPTSEEATRFVAVEDWLNDGVPLHAEIADACSRSWYGKNEPALGNWRVDRQPILPDKVNLPVCVAIPERDPIVPPRSALALANILRDCMIIRPKSGHIGMVVGSHARTSLWCPLLHWMKRIAATQKKSW